MLETSKMMLPSRRELIFYKIAFFESHQKRHSKIIPKTFRNLPRASKNQSRIIRNRFKNVLRTKMRTEKQKNRPRSAQGTKKAAQEPPRPSQRERTQNDGGLRVPLPADHLSWVNEGLFILGSRSGGRSPAHCDAERTSAGVLFRYSVLARPYFAKGVQNLLQVCSKSFKSFPKPLPNPPQALPKSTQNLSQRSFGAHLEPMVCKS